MTSTQESPALRDDLFPAQVHVPPPDFDHTDPATAPAPTAGSWVPPGSTLLHRPARVLLSAAHLWVYIDSPDGPVLEIHGALDDLVGTRRQGFRLTVAATESDPSPRYPALVVTRYANCGCGSRLRSFRPFAQMRLLADSEAPRVSHR